MIENFARAVFILMNMSLSAAVLGHAAPAAAGELRLLMFDQPGCIYCAKWEAEIGPIYPNTDEAALAPLTRHRLGADLPPEVTLSRPAALTPTFVLLDDGREVGRIEGYGGDQFFWFLLGELIDKVPPDA